MTDLDRLSRLSNEVAVVGVGETDFANDYSRSRSGQAKTDRYLCAAVALKRALADAGLAKDDLDGLIVGPPLAYERTAEVLGIEPRWGGSGDAIGALLEGVLAITAGLASTVALVYGNDQRSVGTAYGGPRAMGGEAIFESYVYYAPWGMTSQGALYAMMTQRYMQLHGVSAAHLGQVAVAQRQFASLNPNAIMRSPITIDDYLGARVYHRTLASLRLLPDQRRWGRTDPDHTDRASRSAQPVVTVAGLGRATRSGKPPACDLG